MGKVETIPALPGFFPRLSSAGETMDAFDAQALNPKPLSRLD